MPSLIPCTTWHAAAFCHALYTSGKRWDRSIKMEYPLTENIIFPRPFFLPPTYKQQTWSTCQRWETTTRDVWSVYRCFFSRDLLPFYYRICPTLRKLHIYIRTQKASFGPFIQQQEMWRNDLHNNMHILCSGSQSGIASVRFSASDPCVKHTSENFKVNSDFLRKQCRLWGWQIHSRVGLLSLSISHSQRRADSFIPPAEREV